MAYYGTLADANVYNADRGRADWAAGTEPDREAALVRGSDYVDQRYGAQACGCGGPAFPGKKTGGREQEREWPRTGATDRAGNPIPDDEVPIEVERATYEAAYRELLNPGSLSPDYVPAQLVNKEKVGPIEVGYAVSQDADGNPLRPVVTVIDEILSGLLTKAFCWPAVRVV